MAGDASYYPAWENSLCTLTYLAIKYFYPSLQLIPREKSTV
jgi:hypothetical protein